MRATKFTVCFDICQNRSVIEPFDCKIKLKFEQSYIRHEEQFQNSLRIESAGHTDVHGQNRAITKITIVKHNGEVGAHRRDNSIEITKLR